MTKKTFTTRAAQFLLAFIIAAGYSACRKTPVSTNPDDPKPKPPVSLPADWKKVPSLPESQMLALEIAGNTLYAASASGIVYSSPDGSAWTASTQVGMGYAITALAIFNNKLYAGTAANGIFTSADGGKSWVNSIANFPDISSFAALNDTLYSASALYSGIRKLDEVNNQWSGFNMKGLPTNYNLDIQKLIAVNNTLVTAQGENGNYYVYDKKNASWDEKYFFKSYSPGLRMSDIIYDSGIFYAGYSLAVLSSQDAGANWSYDTVGLKRGPNLDARRVIYAGKDYNYTIYYQGTLGTWVQKRHRGLTGSSWATGQEALPVGNAYSIGEFNGMLFLATDNGLYFKNLAD